jgi:hypothetical protein
MHPAPHSESIEGDVRQVPPHECRGLVPTFTGFSDYPEKLPDETIGRLTARPITSVV